MSTPFQKFAAIIVTADHGCSTCVRSLVKQCEDAFPDQDWQQLVREAAPDMGKDLFDPPPVRTGPLITMKDLEPAFKEYARKMREAMEQQHPLWKDLLDGK